ncbi:alpha/beta hydrolase [Psychromicrobium sp. YIM B11713]|uniref:alpha/beta hydrolase n=1 Tax=Psychromicrobium sp. YIM B11713 TaxID=3145233 RepID=UPI00374E346E
MSGPRKHLKRAVPITLIGSGLLVLGVRYLTESVLDLWGQPLHWRIYLFTGLALAALALLVPRLLSFKRWYTKLLAPLAAILVIVAFGLQINQVFGYYPTAGSLWGDNGVDVQAFSPSDTVNKSKLTARTPTVREEDWQPPTSMPDSGKLITVQIPASVSNVHSGISYVYIPPAYRVQNPANVPVLVLIHGNPGDSVDWQRGGLVTQQMDAYAAEHKGIAPLVVMPDVTSGNAESWSLCMDSPRGKGATFLAVDVPNYVKKTFGLGLAGGQQFMIGGMSYGGTCALQLGVTFPAVYPAFLDFSGERGPYINGGDAAIISKYFNGDADAFAEVSPLELLKTTKLPHSKAIVLVGSSDYYRPQGEEVYRALKAADVQVELQTVDGDHGWAVWRLALGNNMPRIMQQFGVS